jgi:hypothetical protein
MAPIPTVTFWHFAIPKVGASSHWERLRAAATARPSPSMVPAKSPVTARPMVTPIVQRFLPTTA